MTPPSEQSTFPSERDAFIEMLNQDCEGDLFAGIDRIKAKQPEPHPCSLCGWSLDGHRYTFSYRYRQPDGTEVPDARLHLSCYSIVRGAELARAEAKLQTIDELLPKVYDGVHLTDCPYVDVLMRIREQLRCI